MSYRVGTPNYNLPQTEGTDKRDWFDTNEAFRNVDADLHAVVEQSSSQSAVIEALQTDVGNLQTGLEDTNTEVDGIKTKQATDEENIAQNAQAISQLNSKVDNLDTDLAEMIEVTEEPSATATVQHNVGTYFRYNDNLWITTVLIRVGDEIVPNVNCETTDVMSRVYQLEHSGGGSISADAVTFDNTGTDLVSQNVEAAIKEVNGKTGGTVIDDSTTGSDTTWSSQKINADKADKSASMRYNVTSGKPEYWNGTQWVEIQIGGGGMPILNYANPLHTFSANDSWTASKDCWIVGNVTAAGASSNTVSVDGTVVASGFNGTNSSNQPWVAFPVGTGQVVTTVQAGVSAYETL